ncbi:MAG: hypothetical protein JWR07_1891 [Nevskia sp.]|nr:hypothetical protein [Nevskia sp.]
MSILAQLVIALAIFAAGAAGGVKWHAGQDAIAEVKARELRESDARQQRKLGDTAATGHEADKAKIRTEVHTVTVEVEHETEKLVYRNVCIEPDGMRLIERTLGAPRPAASQPAPAVPGPERPGGWHWGVGPAVVGGGDRPVPRMPEPAAPPG